MNSLNTSVFRSIEGEITGNRDYVKLELSGLLGELVLNEPQTDQAALSFHLQIFQALGLFLHPLGGKRRIN